MLDVAGDEVGTIQSIVVGPERDSAITVVSSGAFLRMGGTDILISLDALQSTEDDRLQAKASNE